MNKNVNT